MRRRDIMPTTIHLDVTAARGFQLHRSLVQGEGSYEPEVFGLVFDRLARAQRALFINVGANIGFFPLAAARLNELGTAQVDIYAHEPLPRLLDGAQRLQADNGLTYALSPVALSDTTGTADFYVSAKSDTSNSLAQGFRPAKEVITVDLGTLDNTYLAIAEAQSYDEVLVMVDVETAEPSVLRGAFQFLKTVRPNVICEVLPGRTEVELGGILDEIDYVPYRFDGTHWVLEGELRGSTSHRDWLFVPAERRAEFGDAFDATSPYELAFTY
jgi:FkbM family methyltransferase